MRCDFWRRLWGESMRRAAIGKRGEVRLPAGTEARRPACASASTECAMAHTRRP